MKRKELHALFAEVSSKCNPIRGIYSAPATEREKIIKAELKKFKEKSLEKKEKEALEKLFLSQADSFNSPEEFKIWFSELKKGYAPDNIPDSIYTKLMYISTDKTFDTISVSIQDYLKKKS